MTPPAYSVHMAVERTRASTVPDEVPPRWSLHRGDVRDVYVEWPRPSLIISDGAYGVGGFPGDPRTPTELANWYAPHIENWSKFAQAATTLWFWNTEIGWAHVHPLLAESGWEYVQSIVWDKGISHIAGNVNGDTIRQFPVATEVCVFYRRKLEFETPDGVMSAKRWLRYEWQRARLPLHQANAACGVANAATRKYLTQDWLWYLPPPGMMERLVSYANCHGDPQGAPYYCLDGSAPVTAAEWSRLRHTWTHAHGLTNVWSAPALHGGERYKGGGIRSAPRVHKPGRHAAVHLNQKPIEFMHRIIAAATNSGDVVWEPFGGLCSGSAAAILTGRRAYAAECVDHFAAVAEQRLIDASVAAGEKL